MALMMLLSTSVLDNASASNLNLTLLGNITFSCGNGSWSNHTFETHYYSVTHKFVMQMADIKFNLWIDPSDRKQK